MEQAIQFVTAPDGVKLAVATVGTGPPLIIVPHWITHLELDWEVGRPFFERLASHHLLIRYDKRGSGLSDRGVGDYSAEAHVRDLEAIVDALELRNVALIGESQGAPICITYAAEHPDNVSHLIVYGGYHNGHTAFFRDLVESFASLIRADWDRYGISFMLDVMQPSMPPELHEWATEWSHQAATAEDAAATWLTAFAYDVTSRLSEIKAPTLVVHRRDDRAVPFEQGREIAAGISGARFVPLEGDSHVLYWDFEPVAAAIESFLLGEEAPHTPVRIEESLRTILFTDMEGSTALTQRLGDAKAQEVLNTHNGVIRTALANHGGSEIKHTGDGIMVSFPAASKALQAAIAVQRLLRDHNREHPEAPIRVRIGLNAGEPVAEGGDLFGTAVQLAARICARAEPGQILVSNVVEELATGKDITFVERDKASLKGFTKPIQLHEVAWEG